MLLSIAKDSIGNKLVVTKNNDHRYKTVSQAHEKVINNLPKNNFINGLDGIITYLSPYTDETNSQTPNLNSKVENNTNITEAHAVLKMIAMNRQNLFKRASKRTQSATTLTNVELSSSRGEIKRHTTSLKKNSRFSIDLMPCVKKSSFGIYLVPCQDN
jgi:hypothetical protein